MATQCLGSQNRTFSFVDQGNARRWGLWFLLCIHWVPQWVGEAAGQNLDNVRFMPMGGMRGGTVSIELPGKYEKWPVEFWAEPGQIRWAATEVPGKITASIPADAKLGVHWVRLISPDGVSALQRFIVGEEPEVLEVEPNDGYGQAQVIEALPVCINGVLSKSGDVDHYRVALMPGQVLRATLDAHRILGSPMDGCLELVDESGNVLAQNLDALGLDPRIEYRVERQGMYSLRVYAFPEAPDSTIGYAGGEKYQYRLRCAVDGKDDLLEGFAEGAVAIEEPSGRGDPWQGVNSGGSEFAFWGSFEAARDEDFLQWETKEPAFWRVTAKGLSLGSLVEPVVEILDGDGKVLGKQGESGEINDPSLVGQMKQPGVYRVGVRDLHGRFGPQYRYRLELVREHAVVRGTVASDAFIGKTDKPLEIEVSLERMHGCAEEATVRLVGLPATLVSEPVVSKMKEDSEKKVVLKVAFSGADAAAGAMQWSGPVGIEIQTTGREEKESVRSATTKQPWLWIRLAP